MLLELDPKGHFTPIIIQEKRKDNLRQQREDKAPADKEGGYDRRGCSRFETERINRKLCCEDNWESASWLPIKTNLEFNVLGMQMATSGFCPPVYAKNEWKVLGQAGETSGRVWTPLPFIAMHPSHLPVPAGSSTMYSWAGPSEPTAQTSPVGTQKLDNMAGKSPVGGLQRQTYHERRG